MSREITLQDEDVGAIVGIRGKGKSFKAKLIVAAAQRRGQPVVVFDVHDEYSVLGRPRKAVNLGTLRQRATITELLAKPEMLDDERLNLAVVPSRDQKQCVEDLRDFKDAIESSGNLLAVFDEVGFYSEFLENELNTLATQSRHDSIPILFVAQRLVQIPLTARSQIGLLWSFCQTTPADLKALEEITADPSFRLEVPRLSKGEHKFWRAGAAQEAALKRSAR